MNLSLAYLDQLGRVNFGLKVYFLVSKKAKAHTS